MKASTPPATFSMEFKTNPLLQQMEPKLTVKVDMAFIGLQTICAHASRPLTTKSLSADLGNLTRSAIAPSGEAVTLAEAHQYCLTPSSWASIETTTQMPPYRSTKFCCQQKQLPLRLLLPAIPQPQVLQIPQEFRP